MCQSRQTNELQRNILKVNIINFFSFFMLIMPILIPYWQSKGLTMAQIYLLQAIYGVAIFLAEVPSGYLADHFGRKNSLIIGGFLWSSAFVVFCFANSFEGYLVFEILCAMGTSCYSGSTTSLLYDSLGTKALIKKVGPKVISNEFFSRSLGETTAAFSCFLLFPLLKENIIYVQAVICFIPFILAIFIDEPTRHRPCKKNHRQNFLAMFSELADEGVQIRPIIIHHVLLGTVTLLAVWMYQIYWQQVGVDIRYFGLLWGINNLALAFFAKHTNTFEKRLGRQNTMLLCAFLPCIGLLAMGFFMNSFGIIFILCFTLCRALQLINVQVLNENIGPKMRATANSVISMGSRILVFFIGPVFGHALDEYGTQNTLVITGITLLPFVALLFRPFQIAFKVRRTKDA